MRRAFAPLARLAALMHEIDPLEPGRRLPALGPKAVGALVRDYLGRVQRGELAPGEDLSRARARW